MSTQYKGIRKQSHSYMPKTGELVWSDTVEGKKPGINFEHDDCYKDPEKLAALSGPVIGYHISALQKD